MTLSYATKIRAYNNTIELENFNTSPVMLTQIEAGRIATDHASSGAIGGCSIGGRQMR